MFLFTYSGLPRTHSINIIIAFFKKIYREMQENPQRELRTFNRPNISGAGGFSLAER
jgi:hypothetical protein